MTINLNEDQKLAEKKFLEFLVSDKTGFILSGSAGTGKTFTTAYLVKTVLHNYNKTCKILGIEPDITNVHFTATTNKAAEILRENLGGKTVVNTIHSHLGLRVKDNFRDRTTEIVRTDRWKIRKNELIIIDECSMIDRQLEKEIYDSCIDCKFLFVGDNKQLPPVMEKVSPIYLRNYEEVELTIPVRNNNQPALIEACKAYADAVTSGVFPKIKTFPGVIDYYDNPAQAVEEVKKTFSTGNPDAVILGYTNDKTTRQGASIRSLRGLPREFQERETVISGSALQYSKTKPSIQAEEKFKVLSIGTPYMKDIREDPQDGTMVQIEVVDVTLINDNKTVNLPYVIDKKYLSKILTWLWKIGDRTNWIKYKNSFLDLRTNWSSTTHKSQGSTYDTVFIDLSDISRCTDPVLAARLLYVAFSRAKNRVVLFGKLAPKYGKIVKI